MIEIKRRFSGYLIDQGKFNLAQQALDECVAEITNKRGTMGEYRIRVQWFSEDELADERRKEGE